MGLAGFGEIAERLRRSTVLIQARSRGSGSGVIWSSDGSIVTNAHVARGGRISVQLWDRRRFDGTVASRDPYLDLGLLRIDAANLPAVIVADSAAVRSGELAIAVGNPMGFMGAVTTGMIHSVSPLRGFGSRSWVQANIQLARGNSGGPLADAQGRVIGINTMVAGRLALAVPSNVICEFLANGPVFDTWLGVTVRPVRIPRDRASGKQAFGVLLLEVPDSPASSASLLAGDILLGAEKKAFTSLDDLRQGLEGAGPRLLRMEFLRGDYLHIRRVTLQLGNRNASRSSVAA